jgi:L-lactate dehydrogenase
MTVTGIASEIVLIDVNSERAMGEAMDIEQGTPFSTSTSVYAGDYSDAKGSQIVVVCSGLARKPGQTRLELAQTNVDITKSIIPEITRYATDAVYVVVANPVDILTYTFCKCSGLPEHQIVGSGTILDTARLRTRLSQYYDINQKNVHAYVLGEHGDSSFIPWSLANISNIPIGQYSASLADGRRSYPEMNFAEIEEYVRRSGASVIERKGATYYAVSSSVCHICKSILAGIDTTMTVSTMMHGEYGIDNVCLSVLCAVNQHGVKDKLHVPLNDSELKQLRESADCLKQIINSIKI